MIVTVESPSASAAVAVKFKTPVLEPAGMFRLAALKPLGGLARVIATASANPF